MFTINQYLFGKKEDFLIIIGALSELKFEVLNLFLVVEGDCLIELPACQCESPGPVFKVPVPSRGWLLSRETMRSCRGSWGSCQRKGRAGAVEECT